MSDPVTSPAPAKRRGCFGLALKSVLGCAAFLLGSLVVLILLLPTILQGLVRSGAEQAFDQACLGTLKVREVELSWKSPQKITEAVLFDPEQHEVARVTAEIPSIFDLARGKGPWKLRVDVDADLVADDRGVVNLQRAIELREKRKIELKRPGAKKEPDEPASDPIGWISGLDAEIVLASRHLAWSDADTRKSGRPFEVRDLAATLRMKPREPLTVHASGHVVSDAPGALAVDVTMHGPIESGKPWPFGEVDATVDVQGFSTAMVDGIAGLGGKLTEVLGPRFDLKVKASGVDPQKGEVEIGFSSPRSSFAFAGSFQGGLLKSKDGSPVLLSLGVPRGFVNDLIAPRLPPGVKIAWQETEKPWTVSITDLELPIPDASALDMKGIAKALAPLRCSVDVDLPARILLESETLKTAGVQTGLEHPSAHVAIAPGTPTELRFGTKILGWDQAGIQVEAQAADLWKSVGEGTLPVVRVTASVKAPTIALEALLGPPAAGVSKLARELSIDLHGQDVSLESGSFDFTARLGEGAKRPGVVDVRAQGVFESGRLVCAGPSGIAVTLLPEAVAFAQTLATLPPGMRLTVAGDAPILVRVSDLAVPLADPLGHQLTFGIDGGMQGTRFTVEQTEGRRAALTVLDVALGAKLPAGGDLAVSFSATVDGKPRGRIALTANVHEPLRLLDAPAKGVPRANAELSIGSLPPAVFEMFAGALPAGASLSVPGLIQVSVHELSCAAPPAAKSDSSALLAGLSCQVGLKVASIGYADEHTRAAQVDLALSDLDLAIEIAPKKPVRATLAATVGAGKLAASVSIAALSSVFPVDADVHLTGLPSAVLDGLSGRAGLLSGIFGSTADLSVAAKLSSADSGTFGLTFGSPSATVSANGVLAKGMITSPDKPALDVTAALTQAWIDQQAGPLLPAGAHLALPDGQGTLHLSAKDVRLPLPQGAITPDALSKSSMHLSASLPALAYTDAKTAAAGAPAVIRDFGLEVDLSPGKAPQAKLSAKIEGTPPGELSADVRALDPISNLAADQGLRTFHVAADVNAKSVPTGLLDALAAQGGMLVDMLGPRLDMALHTDSISQTDGTFTASLDSEKASVHCDRGAMKDGVLRLEKLEGKNEALLARSALTPLFSQRVVGSLVPTLVNLQKPEGGEPVTLAVDDLSVPLDADLSKLDALVRLNLGEVSYKLLPGLSAILGKSDATTMRLPEIRVPIQKGIASYEGLPMKIGGHDCAFKGTFSLVDKSFKMQTELPLSVLGKGVSSELDALRGVVDANTMVPIELRGTWSSPKVSISDAFLKKVGGDALKKEGGNLLDGLLKKKKKN